MSNHTQILENFQNNVNTFIYEDWQEVVVKFTRENNEMVCYAKIKKGSPYLISWDTNLVTQARTSGQIVDKNFYETF